MVHRGWPPGVDAVEQLRTFQYLVMALVMMDAGDEDRERARQRLEKDPEDLAAAATAEPHARWLRETQKRLSLRARWQAYFEHHDVFLLPTTFTAAFPHDHSQPLEKRVVRTPEGERSYLRDMASWIGVASVAGLPATAAPGGLTAAGLPVGLQIVAPMWEDGTAIEFAALLADVIGGFVAPPAFREPRLRT